MVTLAQIIAQDIVRKSELVDENPQADWRSKNRDSYIPITDVHPGQWFHS